MLLCNNQYKSQLFKFIYLRFLNLILVENNLKSFVCSTLTHNSKNKEKMQSIFFKMLDFIMILGT